MGKTGIREPFNSPIPHPGPLDSAPGPAQTTRGILQNLPATPSPGNPLAVQVREGRPARESGEDSLAVSRSRDSENRRGHVRRSTDPASSPPQSDPEGHEGNAVRIKYLEAGTAGPRLENVTAISNLAGDQEPGLLNQDKTEDQSPLDSLLNADCAACDSYSA